MWKVIDYILTLLNILAWGSLALLFMLDVIL